MYILAWEVSTSSTTEVPNLWLMSHLGSFWLSGWLILIFANFTGFMARISCIQFMHVQCTLKPPPPIKCMYSVYKCMVLGACIVHVCRVAFLWHSQSPIKQMKIGWIRSQAIQIFICNYFSVLLVKILVRWVTKPELSNQPRQISSWSERLLGGLYA